MIWILLAVGIIIFILLIISATNKRFVLSQFKKGNVIVTGMMGEGKDMLFCWVVNKRKENYISNAVYSDPRKKYKHIEFSAKVWELANNTYSNFADDKLKHYEYPYPDGVDYYISDAGIYFPSSYQDELKRRYKSATFFQPLARQLGKCRVHINVQNVNRLWDKMREQADHYIMQRGCKVFGKFVFIRGTVYDNYEACEKRLKPPKFGSGKDGRSNRVIWEANNGHAKNYWFIFRLPYKYDDRVFKHKLENGCVEYGSMEVNFVGKEK